MKWICTLLASVALVWGQIAASDGSGLGNGRSAEQAAALGACCNKATPVSHSCCPSSARASCCVQRVPSSSLPSAPASPSGSTSRGLFLALHASLLHLDLLTAPRVPESSPAPVSVAAVVPVPLFLRHGTLLL